MTSLYNLSVPVLREVLETTTHVLNKGEAFAKEHEISDADLIHERLYPDMFNLRLQILVILIVSRTTVTTLTGKDVPGIPERDQSLNKLHSLIDETIEILAAVLPQEVDGKENQATSFIFT
ncbi:hypothetical protein E8E14_009224 [Neopestalotiopsis sp. 37M]|nr:hypothetical protein E8E14_009224 [Neopestalotiopsis sp. 37M]